MNDSLKQIFSENVVAADLRIHETWIYMILIVMYTYGLSEIQKDAHILLSYCCNTVLLFEINISRSGYFANT